MKQGTQLSLCFTANDAKLLIDALQKTLPSVTVPVNDKFVPTDATKSVVFRTVTQN